MDVEINSGRYKKDLQNKFSEKGSMMTLTEERTVFNGSDIKTTRWKDRVNSNRSLGWAALDHAPKSMIKMNVLESARQMSNVQRIDNTLKFASSKLAVLTALKTILGIVRQKMNRHISQKITHVARHRHLDCQYAAQAQRKMTTRPRTQSQSSDTKLNFVKKNSIDCIIYNT